MLGDDPWSEPREPPSGSSQCKVPEVMRSSMLPLWCPSPQDGDARREVLLVSSWPRIWPQASLAKNAEAVPLVMRKHW